MTKTIRPGRSAYLPLGIIASALVVLWVFVWIYRGSKTGAWQPLALVIGMYMLWCLALWRRVLIINDKGILCTYLIGKPRRMKWSDIQRSELAFWIDQKPYRLLVFGDSNEKPVLDIPLKMYDKTDVDFLMGLDRLRFVNDAT